MHTQRINPSQPSSRRSTPTAEQLSDAELVQRCRSDDARAWETVVVRYRRLIYAIPTRMGLEPEEADDVFQNTFIRLVERLETIRDPSLLRAWLVTTARRLSLDTVGRRRAVKDSEEMLGNVPDPAALAEDEILKLEEQHLVRQAFEHLSERCRDLLELLYYTTETPSYEAIGERLRMPLGSIGPTRARCLQRLLRLYGGTRGDALETDG
jgi:RNA polymerase sigma factor (sigma-70 family)